MNRIGLLGLALCGCMLVCADTYGQGTEDDTKSRISQLRADLKPLKADLKDVQNKLELNKDEDLLKLKEAIKEANDAYRNAVKERILADPDGERILEKIEKIEADIKMLSQKPPKAKKVKEPKEKKPKKKKASGE